MAHPWSSADISISSLEINKIFYVKKYKNKLHFGTVLMISVKMATPGLLKIKVF